MKSNYKRTLVILLTSALFALFGTGCGTVNGIGKDVETAGDNIQKAAR